MSLLCIQSLHCGLKLEEKVFAFFLGCFSFFIYIFNISIYDLYCLPCVLLIKYPNGTNIYIDG